MNCFKSIQSVFSIIPVWFSIFIFIFGVLLSTAAEAQVKEQKEELPSPKRAFLRSLVVPGWGHYYVDNDNWTRGKYHLAGEVVLVLSYFGLDARADNLENDFITLALSKAGTDLSQRKRDYLIAVGNYDDLESYNDAQLRTRNWDQLYPETAEYQWSWESRDVRNQFRTTREQVDKHRSQLPTLLAIMAANRLFSGLSAFVRARDKWEYAPEANLSYVNGFGEPGITAALRINF